MRHLVLLLLAMSLLAGERKWKKLSEAKEAVLELRAKTLAGLEEGKLPVPEVFLEADARRNGALVAWRAERWDDAHTGFEAAWDLYPRSLAAAREELASLDAGKPAPGMRTASQRVIDAALAWLSAHQDPIGRWDCDGFMKHDPIDDRCDGPGNKFQDVGVTALAVLAFLESGAPVRRPEVHRALQWLRAQQQEDGVLGTREHHAFIYGHAIATLALAEAYARGRDERHLAQLRPALDFLLSAQSRGAGWRYDPGGGESDTSVTCWCYRALARGAEAGIGLDLAAAGAGARAWLDAMTGEDGTIGYNARGGAVARPEGKQRFDPDRSRAMTAAGVAVRVLLDGAAIDRKRLAQSLDRCLERPPSWSPDTGSIDMYYWYLGTLACAADKTSARKWKKELHGAVLKHQHPRGTGARTGSFDPIGVWGDEGGRVYSTAILALALLHAE